MHSSRIRTACFGGCLNQGRVSASGLVGGGGSTSGYGECLPLGLGGVCLRVKGCLPLSMGVSASGSRGCASGYGGVCLWVWGVSTSGSEGVCLWFQGGVYHTPPGHTSPSAHPLDTHPLSSQPLPPHTLFSPHKHVDRPMPVKTLLCPKLHLQVVKTWLNGTTESWLQRANSIVWKFFLKSKESIISLIKSYVVSNWLCVNIREVTFNPPEVRLNQTSENSGKLERLVKFLFCCRSKFFYP